MRDRRREVLVDDAFEKVHRRQQADAVDAGDEKHAARELHDEPLGESTNVIVNDDHRMPACRSSSEDLGGRVACHVSQAEVAASIAIGQSLVIETEQR